MAGALAPETAWLLDALRAGTIELDGLYGSAWERTDAHARAEYGVGLGTVVLDAQVALAEGYTWPLALVAELIAVARGTAG